MVYIATMFRISAKVTLVAPILLKALFLYIEDDHGCSPSSTMAGVKDRVCIIHSRIKHVSFYNCCHAE